MGRRVDIDETLPVASLPVRVFNELCAHSLETLPEECCGLIVSEGESRYGRLVRCRNEMTKRHQSDPKAHPRDGREAFWMNEVDYLRVREQAERDGEGVTAIYHSHVGHGVYLSDLDLEYAEHGLFPFPDADQIVVGVSEARVAVPGLFERRSDGAFVGRGLVARGAQ